jgi:hypothetical protein
MRFQKGMPSWAHCTYFVYYTQINELVTERIRSSSGERRRAPGDVRVEVGYIHIYVGYIIYGGYVCWIYLYHFRHIYVKPYRQHPR